MKRAFGATVALAVAAVVVSSARAVPISRPAPSDRPALVRLAAELGITAPGGIAIAADFAAVKLRKSAGFGHGAMQALYRRYAFGWQLIDLGLPALRRCELIGDGVPIRDAVSLLAPDAPPDRIQDCPQPIAFARPGAGESGARTALERRFQSHSAITHIAVDGDYAVATVIGQDIGGEAIVERRRGTWSVVKAVGGALGTCELVRYRVPRSIAASLARELDGSSQSVSSVEDISRCRE